MARWWQGWTGRGSVPTWGLTMLAREPADLLLTHLAWHIAAGARVLHLFLDDPDDPVAEAAAALPGVRVTRCDAAFWARHPAGRRPDMIVARQIHCATLAYRDPGADWLLHLDADEFLLQQRPLADELARNADLAGALVIPVRERALTRPVQTDLFQGVFRIPQQGAARDHPLLAPLAEVAPAGVIGHALGKSVTRAGLDVALHPHFARPAAGGKPEDVPRRAAQDSVLLHFDGLTPLHWLAKMLRRVPAPGTALPEGYLGPHRRAQLAQVAACDRDPARLMALHDRLRVVPDPAPWITAGLMADLPFDPAPACRQVLGRVPDFGADAFDASLRAREPVLLAGL